MPGFLLHMGAQVTCAHAGQAIPTALDPRVVVSGQPVATLSAPYTVAGCALPPPPAGNGPCVTAAFTAGSTRVLADGLPILLFDSQAICAPSGTPLLIVEAQTRVLGI
jgi:hypothetical protein